MLPIYVAYDSGIDNLEARAITEALVEFRKLFPEREIVNYGSRIWSEGDYSSADWYVEKAERMLNYTEDGLQIQIDARSLMALLANEPWQEDDPHIDVLLTSMDLTANDLNFCFGMANGRTTVQSVIRYRGLPVADRKLIIKALVYHELGHILGCTYYGRANTENKLGPHCTDRNCVMRQGMTVRESLENAKAATRFRRIYCPLCLACARKSKI